MNSPSDLCARVVVVGAGMAAHRFCSTLSALAPGRFRVTMIGEETSAPYNRVGLSSLLAGEAALHDLHLGDPGQGVESVLGTRVTAIDRIARRVTCADGRSIAWDLLVLACGSQPVMPPISGCEAGGVHAFRTLDDVHALLPAASPGTPAVVIGGGLLGLEAAHGLALRGATVTVVHLASHLMERQLDAGCGARLAEQFSARGIRFRLGASTQAIHADASGRACEVLLVDGERIPADLVVIATGVRPNIGLAQAAGLDCGRGVIVDDWLRTSDEHIFAIGECSEHRGRCYGLVAPAFEQAESCARTLAGQPGDYSGSSESTHLKVSGVALYSAGCIQATAEDEEIRLEDSGDGFYRRLLVRDDRLVGAVLYGDASDASWYAGLIQRSDPVGELRAHLAFGQSFVAAPTVAVDDRRRQAGTPRIEETEVL